MPKTRRDLLVALREKLRNAVQSDPELLRKLKERAASTGGVGASLDILGPWLDEPLTDEEFNRQLELAVLPTKVLHAVLDPRFFPTADKAGIDGRN